MKNLLIIFTLFVIIMFSITNNSKAQDLPKAQKLENANWHTVLLLDLKPGTQMKAKSMIDKFNRAGQKAGTENPKLYEFRTGKWNYLVIWNLDGVEDLNWEISPDNEKWWTALAEQEGGADKAFELWKEWASLISDGESALAISR